ncbi:ABC transporter substrate-binding protein [Paraburkholderia unamae]|uniref:Amino acid ABC transporter substrate-binding protein (PAAT family) n=1 Tax=Paraburkholderia unamae TaxID=219649 RepID=A0ABX5KTT5_9BURK|nr:ABC transporter substrate-binding protein [Paraburkholderia unamae]PVX85179.1 amino acid ABC transporter substrate-binding protein (PAAT family) [Paraburkholderia unamae]RAR65731.1 amino acid ABC transporter substrate-binding protein (PAAT family) [Paraburkholderia unamae]
MRTILDVAVSFAASRSASRSAARLACALSVMLGFALSASAWAGAAAPISVGVIAAVPAASAALPAPVQVQRVTSTGLVQLPDGRLLAPEFARIAQRGELVVAVLGIDQPPFFETREGQLSGLDIDLAHEIAQKLGVKVRFDRDANSFDGVVNLLATGQADLAISKLSRTLPRAQVISFSTPYLRLKRALLLNRVKFAQLAQGRAVPDVIRAYDSTIGVVARSSYAEYVTTNFPHAQVRTYPTWEAVLKALDSGEVTAAYRDEFEVKRVLKRDPTASLRLRVVTLDDLEDSLAIGVSIADTALLAFVNQFLAERTRRFDISTVLQSTHRP